VDARVPDEQRRPRTTRTPGAGEKQKTPARTDLCRKEFGAIGCRDIDQTRAPAIVRGDMLKGAPLTKDEFGTQPGNVSGS